MKIYLKQICFLFGSDIKKLPLIFFAFVSVSLLDVCGLGLIFPYINLIIGVEGNVNNKIHIYTRMVYDNPTPDQEIMLFGMVLLLVFACKTMFTILNNWIIFKFSFNKGAKLRVELLSAYQSLCFSDYLSKNSAEYMNAIYTLSAQFSQMVLPIILRFLSDGFLVFVLLIFLGLIDVYALSAMLVLIVMFLFCYDQFCNKEMVNYGRCVNESQIKLVQTIHEAIDGFVEIKILGVESYFRNEIATHSYDYANFYAKGQLFGLVPRYVLEFVLVFFFVIVVFISVFKEAKLITVIPMISVFAVASVRLFAAVNVFSNGIASLRFTRPVVLALYEHLTINKGRLTQSPGKHSVDKINNIDMKNVYFSYANSQINILENVSLSIKAGESIGLIGTTGAGKTTLINLILGLHVPTSGEICVNNFSLSNNAQLLKNKVAYIPQNIFLADNTITRNIALGIEDRDIDKDRVLLAIKRAQLNVFIKSLPQGLDTYVGDKGMRLSGGQRQRIALARAFYHNRELLILDESTSAVDYDTEREIIKEIKQLKFKKTMIIIAHRLTTLQYCDRIYCLDKGKLVEQGTYEQLISEKGYSVCPSGKDV